MHEDTTFEAPGVGGGISRRDMLRKSAVVGGAGALMWAAPSITKYGSAAFGSEGTPAADYSNFGAILRRPANGDFEYLRIKGEWDDDDNDWSWVDPGKLGKCEQLLPAWEGATKADGDVYATFGSEGLDTDGDIIYRMRLRQTAIDQGWEFANNDNNGVASSLKQGDCCIKAAYEPTYLTWYGPFPNGSPQQPCSDATKKGQVGYDSP